MKKRQTANYVHKFDILHNKVWSNPCAHMQSFIIILKNASKKIAIGNTFNFQSRFNVMSNTIKMTLCILLEGFIVERNFSFQKCREYIYLKVLSILNVLVAESISLH